MSFNPSQPAYQRLRTAQAEQRKPIVFWVGAGLSAAANLPTWPRLRDMLIQRSLEIAATLSPEEGKAKEADLERALAAESLWDAFQIIKKSIGRTEFREQIRDIFSSASNTSIPDTYKAIWDLPGVRGLLTLNIDEFASRSHRRVRISEDPTVFFGRDAADYAHVLSAGRPFVANLHGVMDANKSWVFTRDEISALVNTPGYKNFINIVFGQMTVVFCGISADDSAAGGFLEALSSAGMDLGAHYWITDRIDSATHGWADEAGLSVIRYTSLPGLHGVYDHTSPLLELLSDMKAYISKDAAAPPLIADVDTVEELPPVSELRAYDDDTLRTVLSGYAKVLLQKRGPSGLSAYQDFVKKYSPCIHQAWHITNDPPFNKFYEYEVEKKISNSPFASVWKLRGRDGESLVLKILRMENLGEGPQIESFRRGVQSLEFLTRADVPGTAPLIQAFEIPTSVVMQYVDGDSLQTVVGAHGFDMWDDGLPTMISVCDHLRFGHNLPQGVLHRDVRPSNIMLPAFYWQADFMESAPKKHDVRLLNYDMSWHANARGQTIAGNIEEAGYYAPEQLSAGADAARTTLVDSYGVGMCIYFIFAKKAPPTAGAKSKDWDVLLSAAFRSNPRLSWRSAPARLRRLVERATSTASSERPMMDQLSAELRLIAEAVGGMTRNLPADFWAEELISRSEEAEYQSGVSGGVYTREPRPGRKITLEGNLRTDSINLEFRNMALGATNRSGIDRMWAEKLNSAREILSSAGWHVKDETRYGSMEILLAADISVADVSGNFSKVLGGLQRGLSQVRLE